MNIVDLISQYRTEANDSAIPPFLADSVVVGYYNEAVDEACRRRGLIFDNTTAAVCDIAVTSASAVYALHTAITTVNAAYLVDTGGNITYLSIQERDSLDTYRPTWREEDGAPDTLIVDELSVQIVPPPVESYTLKLEVHRVPLVTMGTTGTPTPTPEIALSHHRYLYHWVLYRAYGKPDSDMYDSGESEKHEARFTRYFGKKPTADRKRSTRANRPHRNKVW